MKKKKSLVDSVLKTCRIKMSKEVGALLGQPVKFGEQESKIVTKAEFFSRFKKEKLVIARMEVKGDLEGESYLAVTVSSAVYLGATLIMIPPPEIRSRAMRGELGDEEADAFGEIANIIAGILATTFGESYSKKLHFAKTGIETVVPGQVDIPGSTPFPDQKYYVSTFALSLGDNELDPFSAIFPLDLLDLDQEDVEAAGGGKAEANETVILVVTDYPELARSVAEALKDKEFKPRVVNTHTNVKNLMLEHPVGGMFIILREINDKSIASVLKVTSVLGPEDVLPIVVCGAKWTQRQVLQAVKYGARDILVLPSTHSEIMEKIQANMTVLGEAH